MARYACLPILLPYSNGETSPWRVCHITYAAVSKLHSWKLPTWTPANKKALLNFLYIYSRVKEVALTSERSTQILQQHHQHASCSKSAAKYTKLPEHHLRHLKCINHVQHNKNIATQSDNMYLNPNSKQRTQGCLVCTRCYRRSYCYRSPASWTAAPRYPEISKNRV